MGDEEKKTECKRITLHVLAQDNTGMIFKMKVDAPLKRLLSKYCACKFSINGVAIMIVSSFYNGKSYNINDTPASMNMEDGDTIEVVIDNIVPAAA